MISVTWTQKKIRVWKNNNLLHTIYLNGRNPMKVYRQVRRIIKNNNVIEFKKI